jgi:hypothetical protein
MVDLPILRTEVYAGSLNGDDRDPANPTSTDVWIGDSYRRYPNAMGAQPGSIYAPGPTALADDDPSTFIRMSSAWSGDWFVILDGAQLAGAEQITVTVTYNVRYLDPQDEQAWEASLELAEFVDQDTWGWNGYISTRQMLYGVGQHEVTWVINDAWVAETGGAWPNSYAAARDGLLTGTSGEVLLFLTARGGALPYEVDVTEVRVTVPDPALEIAGRPDNVRRRFT